MYAAPNQGAGGGGNADEMEEYLLGKKSVDSLIRDKNSEETVSWMHADVCDMETYARWNRLLLQLLNDLPFPMPMPTMNEIFNPKSEKILC